MAVTIVQSPLNNYTATTGFFPTPIGQEIIFTVSENPTVATKFKVKFIAEVHVSRQVINLSNNDDYIGTFKTTPNNKGVGIFDLRPILETFVKPDNEGSTFGNGSRYKGTEVTHPIHLIDKFAVSENAIRYMAIKFKVEWADTEDGDMQTGLDVDSDQYTIFNGVLQYDDVLTLENNNYGYDISRFYPEPYQGGINLSMNFLSNAPRTQYARLTDYGTLPFLNNVPDSNDRFKHVTIGYYWDGGGVLQILNQGWTPGGVTNPNSYASQHLLYWGAFPANLQSWSTIAAFGAASFEQAVLNGLTHYTIRVSNNAGFVSHQYIIKIICPDEKGYEGIRLTWLNQWGTWDYYTFNMKSTRSVTTKRIPYQQQSGTWNDSAYQIKGWKGGKKNFRVNSTEKIKINTDFVSEAEGLWFEELINSNEVYIVNEYDGTEVSPYDTITNKYIEPVTLTTSNYVKKTIANDKLMQYTFEIEKTKIQRTQAV